MSLQPEQIAHINSINWFYHEFPELADDLHHFANERFLDVKKNPALWATANKLKRMGVKKGVLDFFLALPMPSEDKLIKSGLWIELKVGTNFLSKEQKEFMARKVLRGYECVCVWDEEAFKQVVLAYLNPYLDSRK